MKKIIFSLLIILLVGSKSISADYYFVGVDAFNKGVNDKAISNLEHAIRINPKNVNARYYLAQAYLKENRLQDANAQYNRIIIIAPSSDAAVLSQKGISLIQKSYVPAKGNAVLNPMDVYKNNYLDYVLTSSGEAYKWGAFPIKVYIEPKKQKELVKQAFSQWQSKSKNLVSFVYVKSPDLAGIDVKLIDKIETSSTKDSYEAGDSKPYYRGKSIIKSDIRILTKDPDTGADLDNSFVLSTALHEIGHSLGFVGHSPNSNDVMTARFDTPKQELTSRDINTLNMFYRMDAKTLQARKSGQTDVKLQQALEYVKISPEKAVGWANLGDIYRGKKMYRDAIKNYNKAISIEPERGNLYAILGSTYEEAGDKQNAYTNMKKACDLEPSNKYYLVQFVNLCKQMGRQSVAQSYENVYSKNKFKENE